jgi:hypothetical protein
MRGCDIRREPRELEVLRCVGDMNGMGGIWLNDIPAMYPVLHALYTSSAWAM